MSQAVATPQSIRFSIVAEGCEEFYRIQKDVYHCIFGLKMKKIQKKGDTLFQFCFEIDKIKKNHHF